MKTRVVLGVAVLWVLVGVVGGAQAALGDALQGGSMELGDAVRTALINSLPWIPVTLAVVALAVRYPVTRRTWKRHLPIHLVALPLVTWAANVLVVLGFWASSGVFQGWGALARSAVYWALLRIHVAALVYAAIAAVTQGLLYYRDLRDRELRVARLEGQLARARLQALNAQMRPHFLFNTLHTIGQLWRTGRSGDADAMLDHLGALFQRVQATSTRPEVPLEEELDMVRGYLAIEETRFADRLRAEVHATPEALRCRVPPLLLQPLVENAVRHGVSASSSAGRVEVRAVTEGGRLVVEVRDDGPGMDAPTPSPGAGTGLPNTRERLSQLYGDGARLDVESAAGEGVTVRIVVPARDGSEGGPGA